MEARTFLTKINQTPQEIIHLLQREMPKIMADYPVAVVYLYGSLVREQMTPFSDVDIALITKHTLPSLARLNLELDIEMELSAINIPQADARVINLAPLIVQGRVATEGVLLFSNNEEKRVAFETQIRSQYFDLQPVLREQWRTYVALNLNNLQTRGLL